MPGLWCVDLRAESSSVWSNSRAELQLESKCLIRAAGQDQMLEKDLVEIQFKKQTDQAVNFSFIAVGCFKDF